MTLKFEQHNGIILQNLVALGPVTSKWLKVDQYCLQQECRPKNLVFGSMWFILIFLQITERVWTTDRYLYSTTKIQLVQDFAAMAVIAELL